MSALKLDRRNVSNEYSKTKLNNFYIYRSGENRLFNAALQYLNKYGDNLLSHTSTSVMA